MLSTRYPKSCGSFFLPNEAQVLSPSSPLGCAEPRRPPWNTRSREVASPTAPAAGRWRRPLPSPIRGRREVCVAGRTPMPCGGGGELRRVVLSLRAARAGPLRRPTPALPSTVEPSPNLRCARTGLRRRAGACRHNSSPSSMATASNPHAAPLRSSLTLARRRHHYVRILLFTLVLAMPAAVAVPAGGDW